MFDPAAQVLRVVHIASLGPRARQLITSLQRLNRHGSAVPALLDVERRGEEWQVLTDWIEGQSLTSYLRQAREGVKPWPSVYETVRLFRGFVHGLTQLHQLAGQFHGDVSPTNLIVRAQPLGLVLVDYGSAWPAADVMAVRYGEGATQGYAAPERFTSPAAASDQFAATVVFYEMLTGKLPYDGMGGRAGLAEYADAFAKKYVSSSKLPVDTRRIPRQTWRAIDELADTALRLEPGERFANGQEWRRAADNAWQAIAEPVHQGPWQRAGAAVANFIERLAQRNQS